MNNEDNKIIDISKFRSSYETDLENLIQELEDPNLSRIRRRQIESYVDNIKLSQSPKVDMYSFMKEKSTKMGSGGYLTGPLSKQRKEQMKKEKARAVMINKIAKNVIVFATVATVISASGCSFKLYHDHKMASVKFLNEGYGKIYSSITVKSGDTLWDIANSLYYSYPEEVQSRTSVQRVVDEIMSINNLEDENVIKVGERLTLPAEYYEKEESQNNITHN